MEVYGDQWIRIHQLDEQTIQTIYSLYQPPFLVEVRENLSVWLEAKFLDCNLDSNDPSHHPYIFQLIGDLDLEIKGKASYLATQDSNSYTTRIKLSHAANMISSRIPMQPITVFQHICNCLQTEREYLRQSMACQQASQTSNPAPSCENEILDMMTHCNDLKVRSAAISRLLKQIQSCQENLVVRANQLENADNILKQYAARALPPADQDLLGVRELENKFHAEKMKMEQGLFEQVTHMHKRRVTLEVNQRELFDRITLFYTNVLQCLRNWKQQQETTSRHVISIEQIQQWFDGLVEVIVDFEKYFKDSTALDNNYGAMPILARNAINALGNMQRAGGHHYDSEIAQLMKELIEQTFIVETQPQQLLKKSKKIAVKVRFLISRSLHLPSGIPQTVQASILNEAGVKEFVSKNGTGQPMTCGDLANATQKFELDGGSSGCIADFKNIQIKSIKQSKRKESAGDSILDDSYFLLFRTQFDYNGVNHKVFAISVPTKITTHGSQDVRAWETLIWDAADKNQGSDSVPWTQLARILNNKFTMMTKKSLTTEQMKVVEDRAFSVPGGIVPRNEIKYISRAQFCKNEIPKMGFTFWNWFFEIAKLTADHLCGHKLCKSGPWQDDLVIGFVTRERAAEFVKSLGKHGTFLLRYSDSVLGAISITWLHPDGTVKSVAPYNSKDLTYRPLAERILDLKELTSLYPNKEKVQYFKSYILPPPKDDNGYLKRYVRSELRTILKEESAAQMAPQMSPGPTLSSHLSSDSGFSNSPVSSGSEPMDSNDGLSQDITHWLDDYFTENNEITQVQESGFTLLEEIVFNSGNDQLFSL